MVTTTATFKTKYTDAELLVAMRTTPESLTQLKGLLEVKTATNGHLCYVRRAGTDDGYTIIQRELLDFPAEQLYPWQLKVQNQVKILFDKKYICHVPALSERRGYEDNSYFFLRGANKVEYKMLDKLCKQTFTYWTYASVYQEKDDVIPVVVLVIAKKK